MPDLFLEPLKKERTASLVLQEEGGIKPSTVIADHFETQCDVKFKGRWLWHGL